MKITKYLFFLFSLTCTGQIYHIGYKNDDPNPTDFPVGKDTLDIYEYTFTDGKTKDSTLYKHLVYDRKANIISFTKKIDERILFRPEDIQYDNFSYQYDSINDIAYKDASRLIKYDTGGFLFAVKKERIQYHNKNVISHTVFKKESSYSLNKKDTLWSFISLHKKRYEFYYKDTLFTDYQTTQDFTGLYNFENGIVKDSTIYSYPKHLNNQYFYDNDGNIVSESIYARDNQIMTRVIYVYDGHKRLKKEYTIGGLYNDGKPKRSLSRRYRYKKSGSKKVIWYIRGGSKDITIYNSKGDQTGFKRYTDGKLENNDRDEYFYEKDKLIKTIHTNKNDEVITILYFYNQEGFLTEEQLIINGNKSMIRYYYN